MKKMMIAASAAVLALAAPALAQAEAAWYGSVGYANVGADFFGLDVDVGALQGRIGADLAPHVAIEGEFAFGVADDSIGPIDVGLNSELALFIVGKAPVSETVNLFARVGYAASDVDFDVLGSESFEGVAYGVGAEAFFTDKDGVRLDWTRHDLDGVDADVWALAYVRKF